MKLLHRILAIALIVSLLIMAIPAITIAETVDTYVKQLSRVNYIEDLCATSKNAPGWHSGMSMKSASSKQMEEALHHLLEEVIRPNLSYLEKTVASQVALGIENDPDSISLREKRDEYRILRDEVQVYYDTLVYDRKYITQHSEMISKGSYSDSRSANQVAFQVIESIDRLKDTMNTVSENFGSVSAHDEDSWAAQAYELSALMSPADTSSALTAKDVDLKAHVLNVNTETTNRLIKHHAAIAKEEMAAAAQRSKDSLGTSSQEFEIFVVTKYEVLFDLKNENGDPIRNATVKVRDPQGSYSGQVAYNEDARGYLLSIRDFTMDLDINIDIAYEITIPGYQRIYSENNLTKGGMIFRLKAVPVRETNKPYIAGVSFNGEDMFHSTSEIYTTPANDADQVVSAYIDMPGSASSSGSIVMHYLDINSNEKTVSQNYSVKNGRGKVDFTGKWCRDIKPGTNAITFTFPAFSADPAITTLLTAKEPFKSSEVTMQKPIGELNNNTVMSQLLPSNDLLAYTFDSSFPLLSGSKLSLALPVNFPIRVFRAMDGSWMGVASAGDELDNFLGNDLNTDKWKTTSQKKIDREIAKGAERGKQTVNDLRKSYMKKNPDVTTSWLGTISAWWSLALVVSVRPITNKPGNYYNGSVSFAGMFGIQGQMSSYLPPSVPFFKMTLGAKGGVGLMLQDEFLMQGVFGHSEYDSFNVYYIFTISFFASVGADISFGPLEMFSIGTGFKANVTINAAIPLAVSSVKEFLREFSLLFDARLVFYVHALVLHYDLLLLRGYFSAQNGTNTGFRGFVIGIGDLPKSKSAPDVLNAKGALTDKAADTVDATIDLASHTVWKSERIDTGALSVKAPADSSAPAGLTVLPDVKTMVDGYNNTSADMIYFVNNDNRLMASSAESNRAKEIVIPNFDYDEYRISNVSVDGADYAEYIPVDGNPNAIVHVAAVSVGYVSSTTKEHMDAIVQDGNIITPEKTVEIPDESGALVMLVYMPENGTEPVMLYDDQNRPAVYDFGYFDGAITDLSAYPVGIQLKTSAQHGLVVDTAASQNIYLYASTREGANHPLLSTIAKVRLFSTGSISTDGGEEDVSNIKTVKAGDAVMYAGICDEDGDKTLVYKCGPQDKLHFADDLGDVCDLVLFADPNERNHAVIIALTKAERDGEPNVLKAIDVTLEKQSSGLCFSKGSYDLINFGVELTAEQIEMGKLINISNAFDNTIYWYEGGKKDDNSPYVTRIRGVFFDWLNKRTTTAYTLATLDGDLSAGTGYEISPVPMRDWVIGGKLMMACPIQAVRDGGQQNDVSDTPNPFALMSAQITGDTQVELMGASTEYYSMTAGTSGKMRFSVINRGNIPIIGMRAKLTRVIDPATGKTEPINEWYFNHFDQELNCKQTYSVGADQPTAHLGYASIRQVEGAFDEVNEDMLTGRSSIEEVPARTERGKKVRSVSSAGRSSLTAKDGGDSEYARISALMPESLFVYETSLSIPEDWHGKQTLHLEITSVYVPVTSAPMFSFDVDTDALAAKADYEKNLLCLDFASETLNPADVTGAVASDISGFPADGYEPGDILRTAKAPSPYNLEVDTSEIKADYRLFEENGEKLVTVSISQIGDTAQNDSVGNICIVAYVDEETKYPSFTYAFKNHTTDMTTFNITIPVSELTGGRQASTLRICVMDKAEGNQEMTDLNNAHVFHLANDLIIVQQPSNRTVKEGRSAVFSVTASGGTPPYHYQWQLYYNGEWRNIPDANDREFSIEKCTLEMNKALLRCVVTDADGNMVISESALLKVLKVPDTGDHSDLPLSTLLLFLSAALLAFIARRKRKTF